MRFIVTEKGQILRLQLKEEQKQRRKNDLIQVFAPDEKYAIAFTIYRSITTRGHGSLTAKINQNRVMGYRNELVSRGEKMCRSTRKFTAPDGTPLLTTTFLIYKTLMRLRV
jgi:hypothetical protein